MNTSQTALRLLIATAFVIFAAVARTEEHGAPISEQKAAEPETDPDALAAIPGLPGQAHVFANRSGFSIVLNCSDGALAVELTRKTKYYVFAIATSDENCERARRALDEAGVYGSRATVVTGSLNHLPLPDHYGNLVVCSQWSDELNLKEVARILNPNGQAVIGEDTADSARLKKALDESGIKDCTVAGGFALLHGRMPEGVDEWTHYTPRPDNISTSHETIVRPPFRTQWLLAEPSYDDKAVSHAAIGNGRIIFRAVVEKPNPDMYYAFDAFNGTLLWQRPAGVASKNNFRYALANDVYYTTEGNLIVALNAATGHKIRDYTIKAYERLSWCSVAVQDDLLYAMGTTPQLPSTAKYGGASNFICAINPKSGELLWKYESAQSILIQTSALDGQGGLFFCTLQLSDDDKTGKGAIVALETSTGKERWKHDVAIMPRNYNECTAAGVFEGKYFAWCCADDKGKVETKSFDTKTGEMVREYPGVHASCESGVVDPVLFVDGKIYCNPAPSREPYRCYDIQTGARVETKLKEVTRDFPGCASANCLYSGGEGFCVYDLLTGNSWQDPYIRVSDFAQPYVAEGMLFHMPTVCHCPHAFGGPLAMAPAGQNWTPPEFNNNLSARLLTGPAITATLSENEQEEWTHYRGNPGHTGEVANDQKLPLSLAWERKLCGKLTPPSTGGGLVYTASRKGFVWGLNRASGEIRWRFICGASVRVTPAYAKGRVLFGSDDGWVYCLEAKSGLLAWRFRVAPEECYINNEGQMHSLWPSAAGVIVDNNTVYCSGGLQAYDGTYLYSLDLSSGKLNWGKRIGDLKEYGAPQGIMALSGDALIVPVFTLKNTFAYNKNNGEKQEWYKGSRRFWVFGSEAIADGDVYFYGGARLGNDDHKSRPSAFNLMDAHSGWLYGSENNTKLTPLAAECIAPVLGKQFIIGANAGYDRAKYQEALRDSSQTATAKLWSLEPWPEQKTRALALAGNVVLTAGTSEVAAIEAKPNGKEIGRIALPKKILRNSLAVSAGQVLVATEDGSICSLSGKQ